MRRKVLCSILAFGVLLSFILIAYCESKETQHDRDIELVLLGSMSLSNNEEALDILQWAAYFSMDCIGKSNPYEQENLDKLRSYAIVGVPAQVADFHYQNNRFENQHHERCTHMGWNDLLYGKEDTDIGRWVKMRKPLLVNAVSSVFAKEQSAWWKPLDVFDLFNAQSYDSIEKSKIDSFAAMIYYVHVLGDHCYNTRTTLPDRIPLARKNVSENNPDLITDLKTHLMVLFAEQTFNSDYQKLIDGLEDIRQETLIIIEPCGITTDEQYAAYQAQAVELMNLLKSTVYKLLKEEPLFAQVFYAVE